MSQFKRASHKKINQSSTNSKQSLFILSDDEHDNSSLELTATTTIKQPKSSKLSKEPKTTKPSKPSKEFLFSSLENNSLL